MNDNNNLDNFVVDSDVKARWAINKIKALQDDCDAMTDWYNSKIKEITEQTKFERMKFERMLSDYFATVPHKKTKTQESYSFPGGKLILKTQNPEYRRDDKTVIAWLKENGGAQFVKVEEKLAWSELKDAGTILDGKMFDANGEEIPGIEIVEREPEFSVKVEDKKHVRKGNDIRSDSEGNE